jgi:hypothetical protein
MGKMPVAFEAVAPRTDRLLVAGLSVGDAWTRCRFGVSDILD